MTSRHRAVLLVAILGLACSDPDGPSYTPSGPCDTGLAMASTDPRDAARTMGICDGLVSAAWVYPDGSSDTTGAGFHIGHGLLAAFGPNNVPVEGSLLLAISSGTARAPSHTGYAAELDKGYGTTPPAGFPQGEASCNAPSSFGYDGIALYVVLEVPAGVRFLAFDYAYFSRDYPEWVCTEVVDQAAGLASGIGGSASLQNILLDVAGNPMFASPTSMRACTPPTPAGAYTCPLGTTALTGTGFDNFGSTDWLRTSNLPVTAGDTVRIRFAIWDSQDGIGDSSLLLDNFTWVP